MTHSCHTSGSGIPGPLLLISLVFPLGMCYRLSPCNYGVWDRAHLVVLLASARLFFGLVDS